MPHTVFMRMFQICVMDIKVQALGKNIIPFIHAICMYVVCMYVYMNVCTAY